MNPNIDQLKVNRDSRPGMPAIGPSLIVSPAASTLIQVEPVVIEAQHSNESDKYRTTYMGATAASIVTAVSAAIATGPYEASSTTFTALSTTALVGAIATGILGLRAFFGKWR